MALKALVIEEANGDEISLKNVPLEGATALIPVPPVNDSRDFVLVNIAGNVVVPRQPVGAEEGGFYRVLIPREKLLVNLGSGRTFDYVIYSRGINPAPSDPVDYDITH